MPHFRHYAGGDSLMNRRLIHAVNTGLNRPGDEPLVDTEFTHASDPILVAFTKLPVVFPPVKP